MNDGDRRLRDLFARLKHEDRARTPSFRTPLRQPKRRPVWVAGVAVAAAAAVALILARPDEPSSRVSDPLVDLGAVAWRSPTDFLLRTPGQDMMRSVPAVGTPDYWGPPDVTPRSSPPESTRS